MGDYYEAALRNEYAKSEERLWLEDIINRLSNCCVWKHPDVFYWNHPERPQDLRQKGYSVCFQTVERDGHPRYVMISRSDTDIPVSLQSILDDLSSKEIILPFEKFGDYFAKARKRREPGKYATIKFGSRWYMLSVSGLPKPYYRFSSTQRPARSTTFRSYEDLKKRQLALRIQNQNIQLIEDRSDEGPG
jgi:hypothetical protein